MQLALSSSWDLTASGGQIATVSGAQELEQAVASAVRTFLGECWYDTTQGIPYFEQILGHNPPSALVQALIVKEVLARVPGVVTCQCVITSRANRQLTGQINFTDATGAALGVSF